MRQVLERLVTTTTTTADDDDPSDDRSKAAATVDVLCLQEVDLPELVQQTLERHGYVSVETPRLVGGGSGGRTDACAVYVRTSEREPEPQQQQRQGAGLIRRERHQRATTTNRNAKRIAIREGGQWELVEHEIVRFDDLATLYPRPSTVPPSLLHTATKNNNEDGEDPRQPPSLDNDDEQVHHPNHNNSSSSSEAAALLFAGSNLPGVQQSFLRRNVALLVRLRHARTGRTLVLANAHLYWNPGFEYVKVWVDLCSTADCFARYMCCLRVQVAVALVFWGSSHTASFF